MNLFNLFRRRNEDLQNPSPLVEDLVSDSTNLEESKGGNELTNSSNTKGTLTVSYATGWPIDVIYGYLNKNYEQKGYEDAMLNSNLTFRDMNMAIIRNKILMVFREVNLNYDALQQDLDTRINTCNSAGLLTTVAELEKQASIIKAHKTELKELEEDFRNKTNEAAVPLMSYECGFLRGVSTIAMAGPATKPNAISDGRLSTSKEEKVSA